MKKKQILVLLIALVLIGGSYLYHSVNTAKQAGFYDVKYTVEYSPDSTFHYISERYWFYDRVRDKYYLKPSQVDVGHWIDKGPGRYGRTNQKYARIIGVINDSTFYLTPAIEFSGCILTVPKFDFTQGKKKKTFTYTQ